MQEHFLSPHFGLLTYGVGNFYNWYINHSPKWEAKRQAIWIRAHANNGGKCELCKLHSGADVHHLDPTYSNLGKEKLNELILLCRSCHRSLSARPIEGDPTSKEIRTFLQFFDPKVLGFDADENN